MRTKASQVTRDLRARLGEIRPVNGYLTDLRAVYGPTDRVPDKAIGPYALVRVANDARTGTAVRQATRLRTFEVEVVFPRSAEEHELDDVHVDILRALGFGEDQPERKFPGLVEDIDEAVPQFAEAGRSFHTLTATIGVIYVETYN